MELKLNLILYIVAASLVITGCVSVEFVSTSSQDTTSKSQEQETEVGYKYEFGDSDTEVLYFPHTVTDVNLYKDDVAISNNLFLTNLTDGTHTSLLCQIPGCLHDENIADCHIINIIIWIIGYRELKIQFLSAIIAVVVMRKYIALLKKDKLNFFYHQRALLLLPIAP